MVLSPSKPPVSVDNNTPHRTATLSETSNVMPTNPTVEVVKEWDDDQLVKWIQQKRPKLLKNVDNLEKFKAAQISGDVFLTLADDVDFFKNTCNLPAGPSKGLANLASEIRGVKKTIKQAFPKGLRYQPPHALVKDGGARWVYQQHEEMEELVRPALIEHFEAYTKNSMDKTNTPIYFFLGGAGVGKSRNAMEFPKTLISCCDQSSALRRRLENAKVFLVSLENGTGITLEEKAKDPLRVIGTRMLLQLLPTEKYHDVDQVLEDFDPPTPIEVLQLVARGENEDFHAEFTGIIVVDGVHLFSGPDKHAELSRTLSSIADIAIARGNSIFVIPCCTATVTIPIHNFIGSSHRNRVSLPMKLLDPPKMAVDGGLASVFDQTDPLIQLLIVDCDGNARALEALHSAIGNQEVTQISVENVLRMVLQKLTNRYSEAIRLVSADFIATLRAIWLRHPLREDEKIPGTEITSPNNKVDPLLRDWQFWDYADILNLLKGNPSPGVRTWQNFESHCAHIRAIKSKIFGDGCTTTLSSIHFGARLNGDREIQNRPLNVRLARKQHATKTSPANESTWRVECRDGDIVDAREGKDCVVNAAKVSQCKYYTTGKISGELFRQEYEKSVSDQDFFILLTTAQANNFPLPENSGVVDEGCWFKYFGPRANRLFMFHQLIIDHEDQSHTTNQGKWRAGYDIYKDIVDGREDQSHQEKRRKLH
ncbi:hypothetical protein V8E54_011452 [Elaphomyces granulatus]